MVERQSEGVRMQLPVSRPAIGPEELDGVRKVFESGWLGLGSVVYEFETALKGYLDADHVVAVNTGTSAIHLALDSIGVGPGDEVIVPSLTFSASVQAITACGASPVFCEIEADTLNINVSDAADRVTDRTKAILPVHYCGVPCDMDSLLLLADARGVSVVEDACHAFGSKHAGRQIGSFGHVTCFSFDPIKTVTCGEGGAIACSDEDLAEKLRTKRMLGIDKDTWHRYRNERSWFYDVVDQGFRYHMSNINAAIGLEQLNKVHGFIDGKQRAVRRYDEAFKTVDGVTLLRSHSNEVAPFYYIVRVLGVRDKLMRYLEDQGVGTGVHYIPNHLQTFFGGEKVKLPVTEAAFDEILTLPLFNDISDEQVDYVVDRVRRFFSG